VYFLFLFFVFSSTLHTDLPPSIALLLDPERVKEWITWLEAYYGPGSTVRNKCWLVKGFVKFLRTELKEATNQELTNLILCKKLLGRAANRHKLEAAKNRVLLADEKHMTANGEHHSPTTRISSFMLPLPSWPFPDISKI